MTDRVCACGCGTSLAGYRADAKWASEACALRWCRAHPGLERRSVRTPHVAPTRTRSPGGVTVSYRKAVDVLTRVLADGPVRIAEGRIVRPHAEAERLIGEVLSPGQRARLEASRV